MRLKHLPLCVSLALLPTATPLAEMSADMALAEPAPGLGEALPLAMADRHLLSALQAPQEAARLAALQAARAALAALGEPQLGVSAEAEDTASTPLGGDWLAASAQRLDRLQRQTGAELRMSLAGQIGTGPYGAIPERDLAVLEQVSDALRLLGELQRLGGGDAEALAAMQATYWDWLLAHRERVGLAHTALGESAAETVFDQRVLASADGAVKLYQLTGSETRTLAWREIPAGTLPAELLAAEGLRVDPECETAPWLLVLDGADLPALLEAHRHWLEAVRGELRLVLRVREDYAATVRALDPAWFAPQGRMPYVLAAAGASQSEGIYLVDVGARTLRGYWPMASLAGKGAAPLKALVNRILAAASRQ